MLTPAERARKAKERFEESEYQRRVEERKERVAKKKRDSRRNIIIGDIVAKYFPEVCNIDPGNNSRWADENFKGVEYFISALASDKEYVKQLKEKAICHTLSNSKKGSHISKDCPACVSGHLQITESAYALKGGDRSG